jgi:hypothetical protein
VLNSAVAVPQPEPVPVRPLTLQERAQAAAAFAPEWVHWDYSAAEWQQWIDEEWQRTWKPTRRVAALCVGSLVLVLALHGILLATRHAPLQTLSSTIDPWYMLLIGGAAYFGLWWTPLCILAAVFTRLGPYQDARHWRAVRERGPRTIRIGPMAFWQAGQGMPLLTYDWELGAAWLTQETPAHPQLVLQLVHPRRRTPVYQFRLPVPVGHEAEAAQVVNEVQSLIADTSSAGLAVGNVTGWLPPLPNDGLPEPATQRIGEYY